MKYYWHITYINPTTLPPGGVEALKLPPRLVAQGSESVIKNGLKLFITDINIRSVSTPWANDPSAHLFIAENGNPVNWMLASFNAREGWHPNSPFVIEGNEALQREILLVCASLSGVSDSFLIQMSGYTEVP